MNQLFDSERPVKGHDKTSWMPWIYGCGCGCFMLIGFAIFIGGMIWYATTRR
ncbi:MAG: hypothetical protein WCT04_10270 [Planctomycetota bacterium]